MITGNSLFLELSPGIAKITYKNETVRSTIPESGVADLPFGHLGAIRPGNASVSFGDEKRRGRQSAPASLHEIGAVNGKGEQL